MRVIEVKNTANLGDCVFSVHFLNKAVEINNCIFNFYVRNSYIKELENHIEDKNKIQLYDISSVPNCLNLWFGYFFQLDRKFSLEYTVGIYKPFLFSYYNKLSSILNIESPIRTIDDVYFDNSKLYVKNELCYEHDYFIANTPAFSGQYNYSEPEFVDLCKRLIDNNYKVITINDVGMNIPTTRNLNFNLLEIGALSLYSKNIIGVGTSPLVTCLNLFNVKRFKKGECIVLTNDIFNIDNIITTRDNIKNIKL